MPCSPKAMLRPLLLVLVASTAATPPVASGQSRSPMSSSGKATREAGLEAWQRVYSVLTSPRCIDCHTATNYPQQGDDRHRHLFNVVRGPLGTGVPGLRCVTCHRQANADSTGVPGGRNWHLAPLSMKWQDPNNKILPSADVCASLTNSAKNGHLGGAGILKHHEEEPLVLWAFHPGLRRDGNARSLPPLTHEEFVSATQTWVEAGMPCPK
jgi:hypothetical protein